MAVSAPTVTADTTYTITITATRGAVSGTSQMTLTVLNLAPSKGGGGLDPVVLLIGGAVAGTGAAGGAYIGLRRRGRKKP